MKRALMAIAALLISSSLTYAQTGGVRGKILDDKGQPIEAVAVKMEFNGGMSLTFDTKTNKKGEFMQIGLRPGNWKFTYTKDGFQPFASPARISLGDATVLPEVRLAPLKAAGAAAANAPADDIQKTFAEAVGKIQAKDYDGAIVAFDLMIAKTPIPEAYYNKGYAQVQKKDYTGAEVSVKKALDLKADYNEARLMLSTIYTNLGMKDKAVEVMSSAPGAADPKQLMALGETLINNGDWPKATEAFLKLEALDPKNVDVQYYLGTSALMNGKTAECASRLEKYIAANPPDEAKKATAAGMLSACKK